MPELREEADLTELDFERHPVWIGVHNFDSEEDWYEDSNEETYRPWLGSLPFSEQRGLALVAAILEFADGSRFAGYYSTARDLDDQCPRFFVDGRVYNFVRSVRQPARDQMLEFFGSLKKSPSEVFPVKFWQRSDLNTLVTEGIVSGFSFPRDGSTLRFDAGEWVYDEGALGGPEMVQPDPVPAGKRFADLTLGDFLKFSCWRKYSSAAKTPEAFAPPHFTPVVSETFEALIAVRALAAARFVLADGSLLHGFLRLTPLDWMDIEPEPVKVGSRVIQVQSPRIVYGASEHALVAELLPHVFIEEKKFGFWCPQRERKEVAPPFYRALKKKASQVFPMRFESSVENASAVCSGELLGFYLLDYEPGSVIQIVT
jgi:hypothetical protein